MRKKIINEIANAIPRKQWRTMTRLEALEKALEAANRALIAYRNKDETSQLDAQWCAAMTNLKAANDEYDRTHPYILRVEKDGTITREFVNQTLAELDAVKERESEATKAANSLYERRMEETYNKRCGQPDTVTLPRGLIVATISKLSLSDLANTESGASLIHLLTTAALQQPTKG